MSKRFTVIPESTFEELAVDAGVLLYDFDPANPSFDDDDIISATTGGINVVCQPSYSDWGEDVDNCPNNTKELKNLDGWDSKISTTAVNASAKIIKLSLGAADMTDATYKASTDTTVQTGKIYYTRTGTSPNYTYTKVQSPTGNPSTSNYYEIDNPGPEITPRADLEQTDFTEVWWVGDKAGGGLVAVHLENALSTGGLNLQTTKNAKGQFTLEITGHTSINAQNKVPMTFYSTED